MKEIEKLFDHWEETIIWSCLQGVMGEVHTNDAKNAAAAILGDFAFFAGTPCEELIRYSVDICKQKPAILIPQNEAWEAVIESCCGTAVKRVLRYAFYKEKDVFSVSQLEQAVLQLPEGYEMKMMEEKEYDLCREHGWSKDLVSQYPDYDAYRRLGIGVAVYQGEELVAGASSYSRYREGIEIEIDTREDHRRKGLACVCGAKLILECLKRDLYPSWDAQNLWSAALAEKLGYHFSHAYTAYERIHAA